MLLDEVEQQFNLQLLERQQLSRVCSSYFLERGCHKMLEIDGKIVLRWVIRSHVQAAASLRTELGLPFLPPKVPPLPPSQILPGESRGDKEMLGPSY